MNPLRAITDHKEWLDATARSINSTRIAVAPDGDCLFTAIAEQSEGWTTNSLRQRVVDVLQNDDSDLYADSYSPEANEPPTYTQHLAKMRMQGTYGGERELQTAASILDRAIWVLDARAKRFSHVGGPPTSNPVVLTYRPEHFDRLKATEGLLSLIATTQAEGNRCVMLENLDTNIAVSRSRKRTKTERKRRRAARATPNLSIRTANITSMNAHQEEVWSWDNDIVALQETRLTQKKQAQASRTLYEQGWTGLWGCPVKLLPNAIQQSYGEHKGVGLMVKRGIPASVVRRDTERAKRLWDSKRYLHAKVAHGAGNHFLHLFVIYAKVGNSPQAKQERESFLSDVFAEAEIGDVPAIILGDCNSHPEPSSSEAISLAISSERWTDCAERAAGWANQEPEHTHIGKSTKSEAKSVCSRIDIILANQIAVLALAGCKTGTAGIPSHIPLDATFKNMTYRQRVLKQERPPMLQQDELSRKKTKADLEKEAEEICDGSKAQWHASTLVEDKWKAWNEDATNFWARQGDDNSAACFRKGRPPKLRRTWLCSRQSREGDAGETLKMTRIRKTIRRLTEVGNTLRTKGALTPSARKAWDKAKAGLVSILDATPEEEPQASTTLELIQRLHQRLETARKNLERDRATQRYRMIRTQWHTTPGLIYKRLNGAKMRCNTMKRGTEETANVEDMDTWLREAWLPILQKHNTLSDTPTWEAFEERFGTHIPQRPMHVEPLTGRMLKAVAESMPKGKAPSTDGWHPEELALLPTGIFDRLASILNQVEETGVWPEALLHATVSMIAKVEDPQPLDHRPISVMSAVYRLWAKTRLTSLMVWQETWAPESMHGFRTGHGTRDAFYLTALLVEKAMVSGNTLRGVFLDIKKCFDTIPWDITFSLVEKMGIDMKITRPLKSMYRDLKRRFKLYGTVGEEFKANNGILQGCALSIILLNALLAVWEAAVRTETRCRTSLYADDTTMTSNNTAQLRKGLTVSHDFATKTDLTYGSSFSFSTAKTEKLELMLGDTQLRQEKKELDNLGAVIRLAVAKKKEAATKLDKRVRKAETCARRIPHLNVPFEGRAELVATKIMPMALYGCETYEPLSTTAGRLTKAVTAAIWRGLPSRCSEIVRGVLNPLHRTDPTSYLKYQRLLALYTMGKNQEIRTLIDEIRILKRTSRVKYCGPVDILLRTTQSMNWRWENNTLLPPHTTQMNLDEPEGDLLRHQLRDGIRDDFCRRLETRREDMQGVKDGIDYRTINAVWNSYKNTDPLRAGYMRNILAGAELTQDRRKRMKMSTSDTCEHCGTGVEDFEHMWEQCSHTAHIREQHKYAGVSDPAVRESWPKCLRLNAILPAGFQMIPEVPNREALELLLLMYSDIALEREDKRKRGTTTTKTSQMDNFPWTWEPEGPYETYIGVLPDEVPDAWPYKAEGYLALKEWLESLKWPTVSNGKSQHVSHLELALDFEAHTGAKLTTEEPNSRESSMITDKITWFSNWMAKAKIVAANAYLFSGTIYPKSKVFAPLDLGIKWGTLAITRQPILTEPAEVLKTIRSLPTLCKGNKSWTNTELPPLEEDCKQERADRIAKHIRLAAEQKQQKQARRKPKKPTGHTRIFFGGYCNVRQPGARVKKNTCQGSGAGARLEIDGEVRWTASSRLADTTLNVAEYEGLLMCLEYLKSDTDTTPLNIYGSSRTVVDQVNEHCRPYAAVAHLQKEARGELDKLRATRSITLVHIDSSNNVNATKLACTAVEKLSVGETTKEDKLGQHPL